MVSILLFHVLAIYTGLSANSWEDPKTLYPSQLYDIRGVFDGTIIPTGWEGFPTTLYTSTYPGGPIGSGVAEIEGVETVSLAYTTDSGLSWNKLPFGSQGNPIICARVSVLHLG
jgi:beta-fructofuranosidase